MVPVPKSDLCRFLGIDLIGRRGGRSFFALLMQDDQHRLENSRAAEHNNRIIGSAKPLQLYGNSPLP